MASLFAHACVPAALAPYFSKKKWVWPGILCAALPDIDVLGYFWKIPYGSFWGHRGITHSLSFAALIAATGGLFFRRKSGAAFAVYLFLRAASHDLLDALTSGGLGAAFFSPFKTTRYFFPWRPIPVSPLGVAPFFSTRGAFILFNELMWVAVPCAALWALGKYINRGRP